MNDDKCWICLTQEGNNWKRVCNCNLCAHEQCILQWAQSSEETPCCPQCRQEIRIESESSILVELRDSANSMLSSLFGGAIIAIAGPTIATNAIVNTLYEVGAISIRTMCPAPMASVTLGPLWSRFHRFAPFGMPMIPLPPSWTFIEKTTTTAAVQQLYRQVAIPMIPIWLCSSGKYAVLASCALSALIGTVPGLPTQERQKLLGIMLGRYVYELFWRITAGRILNAFAQRVYVATRRDDYKNAMARLDELIDQARQDQAPRDPDAALEQMVEVVEVIEDLDEIGARRDGHWLLGRTPPFLRILQGLITPSLSALMGNLLSKIPQLASWSKLSQNLLGMCLVVLLKDLLDLVVAYKRSKMEIDKHVLNYDDKSQSKSTIAQYIHAFNQRVANLVNLDIRIGVN